MIKHENKFKLQWIFLLEKNIKNRSTIFTTYFLDLSGKKKNLFSSSVASANWSRSLLNWSWSKWWTSLVRLSWSGKWSSKRSRSITSANWCWGSEIYLFFIENYERFLRWRRSINWRWSSISGTATASGSNWSTCWWWRSKNFHEISK